MRVSNKLVVSSFAFVLAGCSGFGFRSSANPAPAAPPASTAPATTASAATAPNPAAAVAPTSAPAATTTTSATPTYYKVTDVTSGKSFYTLKVNRVGNAVVFTDERTGAETTLQNSQVLPVQKMEYMTGIAPTPPAAPFPAAAATPSPAASTPTAAPPTAATPDAK